MPSLRMGRAYMEDRTPELNPGGRRLQVGLSRGGGTGRGCERRDRQQQDRDKRPKPSTLPRRRWRRCDVLHRRAGPRSAKPRPSGNPPHRLRPVPFGRPSAHLRFPAGRRYQRAVNLAPIPWTGFPSS